MTQSYKIVLTAIMLSLSGGLLSPFKAFGQETNDSVELGKNELRAPLGNTSTNTSGNTFEPTGKQEVLFANPIKLSIVKNAPSYDLPEISGSLGLKEAIDTAIKNNLRLKLQEQAWLNSKFIARAALAKFGPSASFNTIYSSSSLNQMMFFPADSTVSSTPMQPIVRGSSLSSIFAGNQALFTGGRLLGTYKAARAQERQQLALFSEERLKTALKVKEAYYNAAWNESRLQVASDYVKYRKWTSSNIKTRMQEGKVAKADYLREEAELSKAQQELNRAYRDYNIALLDLKVVLAVNIASMVGLKDGLETELAQVRDLAGYLLESAKTRPELARAASKLAEMKARRTVAMSKYSPQLNLYGLGSSIAGTNPDNNPSGRWGGVVGIAGGVTLFDSGERLNLLRAANTSVKEAEIAKRDAELRVAQEVSQAWIDLDLAKRNLELARVEVKSAEEDHRLYNARYQVGKSIALEAFDAAVRMFQARLRLLENLYQVRLAEARLNFASGQI